MFNLESFTRYEVQPIKENGLRKKNIKLKKTLY